MAKVSHYTTVYFLRYKHPRYMKFLFTNIQKQQNTLKSSLLFKKNINFTIKQLDNTQDQGREIFSVWFLYEPKHIVKSSSLYQCTFNFNENFSKRHHYLQRNEDICKNLVCHHSNQWKKLLLFIKAMQTGLKITDKARKTHDYFIYSCLF